MSVSSTLSEAPILEQGERKLCELPIGRLGITWITQTVNDPLWVFQPIRLHTHARAFKTVEKEPRARGSVELTQLPRVR